MTWMNNRDSPFSNLLHMGHVILHQYNNIDIDLCIIIPFYPM